MELVISRFIKYYFFIAAYCKISIVRKKAVTQCYESIQEFLPVRKTSIQQFTNCEANSRWCSIHIDVVWIDSEVWSTALSRRAITSSDNAIICIAAYVSISKTVFIDLHDSYPKHRANPAPHRPAKLPNNWWGW